MASKLNPGADATLVNVAYRAAMADTPADYSDTLEKAAESYSKTMEASSEMWGNIAKVGAALGGEMVKNANERAAYAAKTSVLNPKDAEFLLNGLYENKDAQRELGLLPGVFGDRETKMDLAKLKMDQQKIFAEIDLAAASLKAGTDAVAAGTFDTKLSMDGGEMVNAIIKSGLKNTVTDNQNVAKLGRNEFGELMYTLYKENGELAPNPNGTKEPVTMTIKQFNEAIATNVDDKGAKAAIFDTYNNQVADRGLKSRTGVYDEQMKAMDSNWLDTQLEKPVDLKRAMHMKFGYMQTSFFDDITKNQNQYSAELYADLLKATGGDVLTGGIVDGIEDVGEPGINEVELKNSRNYQVLTANLLGMKDAEVTKAYFKDYVLKEFEGANDYGHSNKAPVPGGKTTEDVDGIDFYKNKVQKLNGANWNSGNATSVYNDIKAGVGFSAKDPATGEINDYSYHVVNDKGGWYQNYIVGDNETTTESYIGPNGGDVGRIFTNDPRFKNIETSVTVEEDVEGNVTNSRGINIKTKTKKKYGSFKKGTQSIGLESILSSLQSFDKDRTLIQRQALIKFQEEVKNDTYDNRYKLVQHINSENNTSIGMDQLDTMINDLVADTDPLNNN